VTTPKTDWRTRRVVAKLRHLERERRQWYMAELSIASEAERPAIVARLMAEPERRDRE
jgi:hypothetical protein